MLCILQNYKPVNTTTCLLSPVLFIVPKQYSSIVHASLEVIVMLVVSFHRAVWFSVKIVPCSVVNGVVYLLSCIVLHSVRLSHSLILNRNICTFVWCVCVYICVSEWSAFHRLSKSTHCICWNVNYKDIWSIFEQHFISISWNRWRKWIVTDLTSAFMRCVCNKRHINYDFMSPNGESRIGKRLLIVVFSNNKKKQHKIPTTSTKKINKYYKWLFPLNVRKEHTRLSLKPVIIFQKSVPDFGLQQTHMTPYSL